jgi:hypothetical protein
LKHDTFFQKGGEGDIKPVQYIVVININCLPTATKPSFTTVWCRMTEFKIPQISQVTAKIGATLGSSL